MTPLLRRFAAPAAALLALGLAGACTSTPRGSQNAYEGGEGQAELERIEGNKTLARALDVRDVRTRRNEDGRLVVQFELKNTRSNALRFAWAADWFDQAGFRIDDTTRHWEPVSLGGYGSTYLTLTSPTPAAGSWKLQVTSPDEVR